MKVIQVQERPTAKRARKAKAERKKHENTERKKREKRNEKKMPKPIEFFHHAFPALAWLLLFNWKIYTEKNENVGKTWKATSRTLYNLGLWLLRAGHEGI